jgi:hypothetical protein
MSNSNGLAFSLVCSAAMLVSASAAGQPAITIAHNKTFIAGQIQVPNDWNSSDEDVDNNVFNFSLQGIITKGEAIPAEMGDKQLWATRTVPVKLAADDVQFPVIGMAQAPGQKDMEVVLLGELTFKADIRAGTVLTSGGKQPYRITTTRAIKAGTTLPAVAIGDYSIYSIEAAEGGSHGGHPQPWFTASLRGENRAAAVGAWRMEKDYLSR